MKKEQYENWKDFAMRMAQRGFKPEITRTGQYKNYVYKAVEYFFERIINYGVSNIENIDNWDHSDNNDPNVCDFLAEMLENDNPYKYDSDAKFNKWDEKWGGYVHCCIRAGLDLACNPSGGVVGFRKRDIERMYPEGVPDWIKDGGWVTGKNDTPINWNDIKSDEGL